MPCLRVQATLQRNGLLPEDVIVNTWHFECGSGVEEAKAELSVDDLKAFYSTIQGYFSDLLSGAVSYKVYDLSHATPRVPIYEDVQTITPGGGTPLPAEIASVLSFRGEYVSGTANARRRGRVFLGPLNASSIEGGSGRDMLLDADHMTTITGAAETLRLAAEANLASWVVYSPTIDSAPPIGDFAWATVIGGYMDNAIDVVRSRGGEATTRVAFGELVP